MQQKAKLAKPRVIETSINRQHIVDQVALLLHAWGVVPEKEEITNIQFGELFGYSKGELCPIKIYIKTPDGAQKKAGEKGDGREGL